MRLEPSRTIFTIRLGGKERCGWGVILLVTRVAFLTSLVCLFSLPVDAQVPGGAEAGRIDTRFEERQAPTVRPRITQGLESTMAPAEAAAINLQLQSVSIEGSTVYGPDELSSSYTDLIGQTVSLADVFAIATAITAQYGQDGYLLSRAIVPPQELNENNANIRIQVIEGFVDEVRWPAEAERYRDFFSSYSAAITSERPLNNRTLERYLLLANRLPGLKFETSLIPSETTPNASTLVVTIEEDHIDGYVSADNHGVEASGPYHATIGVGANNVLGIHERIEGSFTAGGPSEDDDLELLYFAFGFSQVLNAEGLTFFVDGNVSRGDPGTAALLALGMETEGVNVSAGFSFPFILTRSESLIGTVAFDFKNSESTLAGVPATEDRLRIFRAGIEYERADDLRGTNQIELEISKGIEGLGSTENGAILASRTPGVVDFFKANGRLSRTQMLPQGMILQGSVSGQWSSDPLLSSQECGYGGRIDGRGFDTSIITGDRCFTASLELSKNIQPGGPLAQWLDYVQPYTFIDYGKIWNEDAPLGTPDDDDGASAGLGLRFGNDHLSADVSVTTILETPESQPDADDVHGWFKLISRF